MKLLYFDDFRLGVLKSDDRVVDVTSVLADIPHREREDLVGGLHPYQHRDVIELEVTGLGRLRFDVRDDLERTWPRRTRLEHQEMGLEGSFAAQSGGKYAPGG